VHECKEWRETSARILAFDTKKQEKDTRKFGA